MPPVPSALPIPGPDSAVTRREWCVLAAAIVIALGARCAYPSRVDVEHFDEGVYAANLYSAETDFKYPYRDLYAPPLLPEMASWGVSLANDPAGAVWVGILGGILLIPVVWWTAREWFGPLAAGSVAVLAATSDYHAWLSRTALTDAWLCLWLTAGAYAGWRAMLSGRPLWMLASGGLAALAWWTKYNGWLTLAIIGGGWLTSWTVGKLRSAGNDTILPIGPALLRFIGITSTAVALWSPVWKGLAPIGGYAAVARNHAGYFVGFSGWWNSLEAQVAAQNHVAGPLTIAGILLAVGTAVLSQPAARRLSLDAALLGGLILGVVAGVGGGHVWTCFGILGIAATGRDLLTAREGRGPDQMRSRWLAWGFATAWLVGLWVAVPMYRPYPRLALPWLVGSWLAVAALVQWWLTRTEPDDRRACRVLAACLFGMTGLAFLSNLMRHEFAWRLSGRSGVIAWEDRTHLRQAAAVIRHRLHAHLPMVPPTRIPEVPAVIYVVGEPALFCHLAALTRAESPGPVVLADAGLGMIVPGATDPRVPTYVIVGGRSARDLRSQLAAAGESLEAVGTISAEKSALVLLDEYPARAIGEIVPRPTNEIEVYYLKADR